MPETWIKICGVKDVRTARAVASAGGDAIGINFYEPSPRFVGSMDAAREIAHAVGKELLTVGLFVNHAVEVIVETVAKVNLQAVQLHGDENIETLVRIRNALPDVKIIWARRIQISDDLEQVEQQAAECEAKHVNLFATLIDPKVDGLYGGSGTSFSLSDVAFSTFFAASQPRILAGGLTPENVAGAIAAVRPWGVDVAGGVESSRGVKDDKLIREFVANVRRADRGA